MDHLAGCQRGRSRKQGRGKHADIRPPLLGAHAASLAIIGVGFELPRKCSSEGVLELLDGEAVKSAAPRDAGVLLHNGEFRVEEGAEGIEAKEEISLPHCAAHLCSASAW